MFGIPMASLLAWAVVVSEGSAEAISVEPHQDEGSVRSGAAGSSAAYR